MTTAPRALTGGEAFRRSGDETPSLDAIAERLAERYPAQGPAALRLAAIRVYHNLESHGPITTTAGSLADALIDRALRVIDARNAARRRGVHTFAAPIDCLARDTLAGGSP